MGSKLHLVGARFSRLVVVRYLPSKNHRTRWECRCDCGKVVDVSTDSLRKGTTKSCGCLKAESVAERSRILMHRHGLTGTPLYRIWNAMRQRCGNPNNEKYSGYGGRGIHVCDAWQKFEQFALDVGPRPSPMHTLDRINGDGNYEPGNVRWATQMEQQNNRKDNRLFTVNGITKTCAQWCRELGLNPNLVRQRIDRDGYHIERALGMEARL